MKVIFANICNLFYVVDVLTLKLTEWQEVVMKDLVFVMK
jgi:hypothetical protein